MSDAACQCEARSTLYVPQLATVERAERQTESEILLGLSLPSGQSLGHESGQFVQVCIPGIGEAPISIASRPTPEPTFELCVRKVGDLTAALHRLKPGDRVGIRGPFGHGFPVSALQGNDVLVVAGGIGMVPVRPLIQQIVSQRAAFGQFTIFYGMRRPEEMLFRDEHEAWRQAGADLRLTVDRQHPDWKGHVGVVTTLFGEVELNPARLWAVVVGPPIMYQFVITECRMRGVADERIVVSLERRMKCGVGKCGHCQINSKYVCKDGPVFTYQELKGLWEAI
jgi:sulfhydrogenase subunit gamma (sulfur reductase)